MVANMPLMKANPMAARSTSLGGGFFNGFGGSGFPSPNITSGSLGNYAPGKSFTYSPLQGAPKYDTGGMTQAFRGASAPVNYKPQSYQAYQFSNPQYNAVSPSIYQDVYSQAMGVASRPIMAQGEEAMRGLSQGFNPMQGGAARNELIMKNAMRTGDNLTGIGKDIGSQLAQARLGEQQAANQAMFSAELQRQQNQSNANFQAAGFGDEQSRFLADETLKRNGMFSDLANNYMNWQTNAAKTNSDIFNNTLQTFMAPMTMVGEDTPMRKK